MTCSRSGRRASRRRCFPSPSSRRRRASAWWPSCACRSAERTAPSRSSDPSRRRFRSYRSAPGRSADSRTSLRTRSLPERTPSCTRQRSRIHRRARAAAHPAAARVGLRVDARADARGAPRGTRARAARADLAHFTDGSAGTAVERIASQIGARRRAARRAGGLPHRAAHFGRRRRRARNHCVELHRVLGHRRIFGRPAARVTDARRWLALRAAEAEWWSGNPLSKVGRCLASRGVRARAQTRLPSTRRSPFAGRLAAS